MTEQEAAMITSVIKQRRGLRLEFNRINAKASVYEIEASYDGPKMVYKEDNGRIHRLSPGMLKIDSVEEWRGILDTIMKGINAEF